MDEQANNIWILEEHDFTINDAEFKKNYMHLLTKRFLTEWIGVFGKPDDYEDESEYYLRLAFGLVGKQLADKINSE